MADSPKWNITPVHKDFQSLTSTASHVPVSYFNADNKAFLDFTSVGSDSNHTAGRISGYQYYSGVTTTPASSVETVSVVDSTITEIQLNITEVSNETDNVFTGTANVEEDIPVGESEVVFVTTSQTEVVNAADSVSVIDGQITEEDIPSADSTITEITTFIQEVVNVEDELGATPTISLIAGIKLGILETQSFISSMKVTGDVYLTSTYATRIGVTPFALTPVTSINAPASTSTNTPVMNVSGYNTPIYASPIAVPSANPFYPTVSNPQTAPVTVPTNTYFIKWLNASIGNVNTCSLLNFSIDLDYAGGTFTFTTSGDPGYNLGDTIGIFGFNGTVTGKGNAFSNGQVGVTTTGIFGSRNLNKQLNLLSAGNPTLFAYLTNSLLSTQQENRLNTFEGAAQAIAQISQCNLTWKIPDVALVDFTVQEGETGLNALSSIASQFGGELLWDGTNNYIICDPTFYRGSWVVPDQKILTGTGINDTNLLDISTGAFGTGFYSVPIETFYDPTVYGLPNTIPQDTFPKVQKVGTLSKALTTSDPLWIFDLPLDTEEAWLQILVPEGQTSTGNQYVTDNPDIWISLGGPSISNPNVPLVLKGGALGAIVPQAQIGSSLFPSSNGAVNNGNFVMSVGVTRNNQSQIFEAAVSSRNQQIKNIMTKLLASFRYVKSYQGTISSYFFGSIPLPGMWASATVCGSNKVEGIIQSVSFSYPGIINVEVAQFVEINFIQNFYKLDLLNPTGIQR